MIVERDVEKVRVATLDDVGGIMEITRPLEAGGQLVQRDRDLLEQQIDCFRVIDIDGMIVASAALFHYPEEKAGELACLAIHPDFQNGGRGAKLVHHIEHWALTLGIEKLFSLTTEGAHWFINQGFKESKVAELPKSRQEQYNVSRASKVFVKSLLKAE
jgi:amino-acid N-acetyltransferase